MKLRRVLGGLVSGAILLAACSPNGEPADAREESTTESPCPVPLPTDFVVKKGSKTRD